MGGQARVWWESVRTLSTDRGPVWALPHDFLPVTCFLSHTIKDHDIDAGRLFGMNSRSKSPAIIAGEIFDGKVP